MSIYPDYYRANDRLGRVFLEQKKAGPAFQAFQKALTVNPDSSSSLFGIGWALYEDGQLEHAASAFSSALRRNPRWALNHYYLGMIAYEQENLEKAEEELKRFYSMSEQKDQAGVLLYLAALYDKQERYAEAVEAVKEFLKIAPSMQRTRKVRELLKRLEKKQAGK